MRDVHQQTPGPAPSATARTDPPAADRARGSTRQRALGGREHVQAVVHVVRAMLVEHDVELAARDLLDRHLVHVVAERQAPGLARVAGRMAGLGHEVEIVRHLRQVIEVVAVDVPRQHRQPLAGPAHHASARGVPAPAAHGAELPARRGEHGGRRDRAARTRGPAGTRHRRRAGRADGRPARDGAGGPRAPSAGCRCPRR